MTPFAALKIHMKSVSPETPKRPVSTLESIILAKINIAQGAIIVKDFRSDAKIHPAGMRKWISQAQTWHGTDADFQRTSFTCILRKDQYTVTKNTTAYLRWKK